jgi:hypothetical protein
MLLLRHPIHRTWLLLAAASLAALFVRVDVTVGAAAGVATLGLAWFKCRLVILDFMELRHAPRPWRWAAEGWALSIAVIVLLVYLHTH